MKKVLLTIFTLGIYALVNKKKQAQTPVANVQPAPTATDSAAPASTDQATVSAPDMSASAEPTVPAPVAESAPAPEVSASPAPATDSGLAQPPVEPTASTESSDPTQTPSAAV